MLNFLGAFWKMRCKPDDTGAPGSVAQDGYGEMSDCNFQASLEAFFGGKCKPKKIEDVDMKGKLEAAGLLQLFDVELWPSSAAVRELATQMKTRTGLVYSDLRKWVVFRVSCDWLLGLCVLPGSSRIAAICTLQ